MTRILLVEDDLSLIEGLEYSLKKNGFLVDTARTVHDALALACGNEYGLFILDLALPDGSGFDVCRKVRQTSTAPILFLTASDEEVNIVMGLDIGGDDYVTKPFRLNELMSRINALLRRASAGGSVQKTDLASNGVTVRLEESRVLKDGVEIDLTVAEYRLLCLLMRNPNRVLTRDTILRRLWDDGGSFVDDNTLSVYVRRLRSKIEDDPDDPRYLLTLRGVGYKWQIVK